jgi:hypothetical protein
VRALLDQAERARKNPTSGAPFGARTVKPLPS